MGPGKIDLLEKQRANPRIALLWKALRPLASVVSFLNTGAHPDDETTAMLAALAYRDGLRIAYACANRGEGGQNIIGLERGADLGALRTVEMERAANEIGLGLYWLSTSPDDPIFDFGFSKSGEETFQHWGRERTIAALVRIIRTERPDIVCPTFLDVPGQHGHHRAMTEAAHEAVGLAADPAGLPDQIKAGLEPWQVSKLYLPAWSGGGRSYDDTVPPPQATIEVESGDFDPVLGATYSQIGEWSRAMHKTQGMGRWIEAKPQSWPLHRAFAVAGMPETETSLSDGLPGSLAELGREVEDDAKARLLDAASGAIEATLAVWPDMDAMARTGAIAYHAVRAARASLTPREAAAFGHRLARKERQLSHVIALAAGVQATLSAARTMTYPGGSFVVAAEVSTLPGVTEGVPELDLVVPDGWEANRASGAFVVTVPEGADPTDPYPQRHEPGGETDPVHGWVRFSVGGVAIETPLALESALSVIQSNSVRLEPDALVVNLGRRDQDTGFSIEVGDKSGNGTNKTLSFSRAGGWVPCFMNGMGSKAQIAGGGTVSGTLSRKSVAKPGLAELAINIDGRPASTLCASHHADTGEVFRHAPAVLRVLTLRAELKEGLHIAYVGGGHDAVDDNLRALGANVHTLDAEALPRADLSGFDTIIVGIFAFGSRPDLSGRRMELHRWVRDGGNLVTLYHRPWDNWRPGETPPAHLEIGQPSLRWRVTDAGAKVKVLVPKHPLMTGPNKITAADWQGWVKERGLYFACAWDDAYVPLVSMADPGEEPHTGALLSAEIGKGRHTHVSLILHHQMDNSVPGAFRLMANLVSVVGSGAVK